MAKKTPTVYAISGNQHVLARRQLKLITAEALAAGYRIDSIDASVPGELRRSLSADGLFFEGKVMVVAHKPEKVPLDLIEDQTKREGDDIVLVLFLEGNPDGRTKFGKVIKKLDRHISFPMPDKPWEAEEAAQKFCIAEAKSYGKKLSPELTRAITERAGFDLGRLSFEIQKMAMLSDSEQGDEITGNIVARAITIIGEAEVQPAIKALGDKNKALLLRTLQRVRETTVGSSPVMKVSAFMEGWAYRALASVELRDKGMSADDAALRLNQNPWFYKNKLLPQFSRWSRPEVIALIKAMGESQRGVLNGHLDPWTGFLVRLMRACG